MSEPSGGDDGAARRLGVIGTLVLDTIRRPGDSAPVEALGGITYALAAFEARPAAGWGTVPLVKVGEDAVREAGSLLERLQTVASREGVVRVSAPNNRVELVYDGQGERTERLSGGVPGWEWPELRPLVRTCDALYVNLIAGWELDLACARRLREGFDGPVYCDLHSLFLDREAGGARRRRVPDDWRGWFGCFDYVQINRAELGALADEADEEPWSLAERFAAVGPRALFVTLGPDGAAWVRGAPTHGAGRDTVEATGNGSGAGGGQPARGRRPPPRRVEAGDPTGCGDVWGMACFVGLLEGLGLRSAVGRANELASRNAACRGGLGLLAPRSPGRAGTNGQETGDGGAADRGQAPGRERR